jgi:methionine-rich copper-binding protein CopC
MRALIATIGMLLATANIAFAHAHLDRSNPPVGGTVSSSPNEIVLTFTDQLEPAFSSADVRNEKGATMQSGKASVDGANRAQLRMPLKVLPPGTYKVNWRVMSVDTHRTEGNFTFRVGP